MASIRIACGSVSNYTDVNGNVWAADNSFTNGSLSQVSTPIAGTLDQALFQFERFGDFSYSISIANGNYSLNLGFAELVWTLSTFRRFSVSAQGSQILNDYDIVANTGANNTAKILSFPIAVSGGTVSLSFTTINDNAKISNIEIVPPIYYASPRMLLAS